MTDQISISRLAADTSTAAVPADAQCFEYGHAAAVMWLDDGIPLRRSPVNRYVLP